MPSVTELRMGSGSRTADARTRPDWCLSGLCHLLFGELCSSEQRKQQPGSADAEQVAIARPSSGGEAHADHAELLHGRRDLPRVNGRAQRPAVRGRGKFWPSSRRVSSLVWIVVEPGRDLGTRRRCSVVAALLNSRDGRDSWWWKTAGGRSSDGEGDVVPRAEPSTKALFF
jgi:hypothetical protein